jgi:hypothetical protein
MAAEGASPVGSPKCQSILVASEVEKPFASRSDRPGARKEMESRLIHRPMNAPTKLVRRSWIPAQFLQSHGAHHLHVAVHKADSVSAAVPGSSREQLAPAGQIPAAVSLEDQHCLGRCPDILQFAADQLGIGA